MKKGLTTHAKTAASPAPRGRRKIPESGAAAGLPLFLRAKAEASLGRSLGEVRVHTDSAAAESARALGARAYTTGRDIVFGEGQYNPHTAEGQRLVAHELAHVVQQSGGGASSAIGQAGDRFEQAAGEAAGKIAAGAPAPLQPAAGAPALQREQASHLKPTPLLARAIGSGTVDGFPTGSAALSHDQKGQIAVLAASILSLREDYPSCSVAVTGHTDAVGGEAFNDALGQERAESVKQELANNGVPPEIILTSSAGSHQLKVRTSAAEPRNRRAEIQFEPQARIKLAPELKEPEMPSFAPPPPKDLPPPLAPAGDALETGRRIFTPIPPIPRTASKTPSKALLDDVDKAMDSVMERLKVPHWARPILKAGAKAAAGKAVMAPLDLAMDKAGLNANEKDAVHAAFSAVVEIALP